MAVETVDLRPGPGVSALCFHVESGDVLCDSGEVGNRLANGPSRAGRHEPVGDVVAAAKQCIDAPVDEVVGRHGLTDRQELRRSIALRGNVISAADARRCRLSVPDSLRRGQLAETVHGHTVPKN